MTCSFDKDDTLQNQKLDEMDLDDILNRAEQHETLANNEGTSLGGEGFLAQFANVSDVKNDMAWEDIIPVDERQRFEAEEEKRKKEEAALFKPVQIQKIPFGVDPKTIVCAFFKNGNCDKGSKCKFSHDLNVGRKVEKKNLYEDAREDKSKGACYSPFTAWESLNFIDRYHGYVGR